LLIIILRYINIIIHLMNIISTCIGIVEVGWVFNGIQPISSGGRWTPGKHRTREKYNTSGQGGFSAQKWQSSQPIPFVWLINYIYIWILQLNMFGPTDVTSSPLSCPHFRSAPADWISMGMSCKCEINDRWGFQDHKVEVR
jgi:hypothetical protein